MFIIIVGGGKLGFDLAENFLGHKYDVRIIEKNRTRCIELANLLDAEVFCGDGTEIEVLEEADAKRCDRFIAVTGSDQDNLVATQLAKREFGVGKVIVRANNPANAEAMRTLGTDIVVSSTEIITQMIEQEIDADMHMLAMLSKGGAGICTMTLPRHSALDGKTLRELTLPRGTLIVSIIRDGNLTIPNGETCFFGGDNVVAVCENSASQRKLTKLLQSIAM